MGSEVKTNEGGLCQDNIKITLSPVSYNIKEETKECVTVVSTEDNGNMEAEVVSKPCTLEVRTLCVISSMKNESFTVESCQNAEVKTEVKEEVAEMDGESEIIAKEPASKVTTKKKKKKKSSVKLFTEEEASTPNKNARANSVEADQE